MSFVAGLRRQLRSVITSENSDPDDLFYQWSENGDEIKNASKLIVGPGQGCIFVYQGVPKAMIVRNGIVNLTTDNIPFWTTVKKFMQFFESEHKVGIYYFRTTKMLDQKWGTTSMIKYEDPKYKFPVSLRIYGNYSFRIRWPGKFFVNVVGEHNNFSVSQFRQTMNARIVQPLTDYLAESKYSFAEIDAHRDEISANLTAKLQKDFAKLGFSLTDLRIEGTNFDDETIERINRIANVSTEAQAASAAGLDYADLQKLEAMRDAAKNEAGGAGIGMGIGAGIGFGKMMANSMVEDNTSTPSAEDPYSKLKTLKQMLTSELINEEEYNNKKNEILSRF
ncbi:MAG: SPFH domain-containing protein [Nitrosomonas sp.]|nr:SPFH domain-containing protein [Nitrosomonas sp.]